MSSSFPCLELFRSPFKLFCSNICYWYCFIAYGQLHYYPFSFLGAVSYSVYSIAYGMLCFVQHVALYSLTLECICISRFVFIKAFKVLVKKCLCINLCSSAIFLLLCCGEKSLCVYVM